MQDAIATLWQNVRQQQHQKQNNAAFVEIQRKKKKKKLKPIWQYANNDGNNSYAKYAN